ncbi:MFS transporter [Lysobacter sp. cf310]|uniref:MFS transporter n=1 Tax=Lysobacter sp. cf310 TaxID=1761790 RepID=UPI0008DF102D|nr:MFS transporter [Lysobacter sp. cf310]SFL22491.1 MFS transporter, DHA1 family, multidrug resistance protein [Lysobacter sp. cf310]
MSASASPMDDRSRRRGLNGLLVYTFFMVSGFAMLMPLVAVHYVNDLGFAAAAVGLALAVRQLTQQGLALVGGLLSDRYGARRMICLGVLLRALGFASLAFAGDLPALLAAMVLSALGGALFEAPYQASIAALTTTQTRPRYYAISNWVSGVATTLGPLIGVALLRFDFRVVCLVAAACFALNFVVALALLPRVEMPDRAPPSRGLGLVWRDTRFLRLVGLMMLYWFVAIQINISFPLLAQRLTGDVASVGLMFAVSAGLTVALQYLLVRWLERRWTSAQVLVAGVSLMSLAVGAIGLVSGYAAFLACVAAFSVGALMTRPTQQTLIAELADPRALGTYLGVSSLSLAVGGGLGNVAGGWLIDVAATRHWPWLPWAVFCAIGLLSAFGLSALLRGRVPRAQAALS